MYCNKADTFASVKASPLRSKEENREFLKEFADSVRGFYITGELTDITAPNKGLRMGRNIRLTDLEVTRSHTVTYHVGKVIEHAYLPEEIIDDLKDGTFVAYAQVVEYQRYDGSYSYGFASLPEILELELKLKVAISCALKPSNKAKRQENYFDLTFLMNEVATIGRENQTKRGIDRLSNLKVDIDLLELALFTCRQLGSSLKTKRKKKKKKGFGKV